MREIKFRAWDKNKEKMFIVSELKWSTDGKFLGGGDTWFTKKGFAPAEKWSLEIMQFTGLKDKNGVEIYEGDLLKRKDIDKPRVVKWTDQNGAYFVLSSSATKKVDWDDCLTDERISIFGYEVIGNIYENPELVK